MKNIVVANPKAAAGRVRSLWEKSRAGLEARLGSIEVRFTTAPGDATTITRRAIADGFDRVIAMGGDGTVNEVVNGFFDAAGLAATGTALVIYPGGTGGDFVRSIGMAGVHPIEALENAEDRLVDVGRAVFCGHDGRELTRHFINISSFGSSGLIVDKVNKATKMFGGKASFYLGTLKGLLQYDNQRVRLAVDGQAEELLVNTVAVANGRFFGGSMMIAPGALVDDGQLDVVVLGDIGLSTFLRYSGKIYKGEHLTLPGVKVSRGRVVEATPLGSEPVLIDLDGEQPGRLPVRYEILPKAIRLFAPWKTAVAGAG
ncbi:MAG: diacylglycerol kinase family lipid kinase [Deltaproteobacteria bacterium]|nr:diacylglycerol kinase family lipid kinase [Deltaproteobacteria bacterium]